MGLSAMSTGYAIFGGDQVLRQKRKTRAETTVAVPRLDWESKALKYRRAIRGRLTPQG